MSKTKSNFKNFTFGFLISSSIFWGHKICYNTNDTYKYYFNLFQYDKLTQIEVPNLAVNLDSTKQYICKKIISEALSDFQKIVETSGLEEAYVYLPERKEFHEITYDERIFQTDDFTYSGATVNMVYISQIQLINDTLHFWHPHPTSYNLKNENRNSTRKKNSELSKEEQLENEKSKNKLNDNGYQVINLIPKADMRPSPNDLEMIVYVEQIIQKDKVIDYFIYSNSGITQYHLTKLGKEKARNGSLNKLFNKDTKINSYLNGTIITNENLEIICRYHDEK